MKNEKRNNSHKDGNYSTKGPDASNNPIVLIEQLQMKQLINKLFLDRRFHPSE